jgi:hypothetical protein
LPFSHNPSGFGGDGVEYQAFGQLYPSPESILLLKVSGGQLDAGVFLNLGSAGGNYFSAISKCFLTMNDEQTAMMAAKLSGYLCCTISGTQHTGVLIDIRAPVGYSGMISCMVFGTKVIDRVG